MIDVRSTSIECTTTDKNNQQVMIFNFNGNDIRAIKDEKDEPWFVAKEICDILEIRNNRDALAGLDDDEKDTVVITDGTPGNPQKAIINESGLYSLILRSRKPEAKAFKKWVTSEVLPTLRKTGAYVHGTPEITDEIRTFLFPMETCGHETSHGVRVIKDEQGESWFFAIDVARILGYAKPDKAIRDHCKKSKDFNPVNSTGSGIARPKIIPESDLYRLIMRSNMPEAERFQDWVVEVSPL